MKRIELDVRAIDTPAALHIYLQYMLGLPAYYGKNLDALYDLLSTRSEQTTICLIGPARAGSALEAYLPGLVETMEDAARENVRIGVEVNM